MDKRRPQDNEETKKFLQEGLRTYAPALVAISEFRRQIGSRLQAVLDDFSMQLSELGLSVADLRLVGAKLDDPNLEENSSWIELKKNYGDKLYTGYHVQWELKEPKDKQVWVGAWIYAGTRTDRDRSFSALKQQRVPLSKTEIEQYSDGSSYLSSYCDPDRFYSFDDVFQSLIEEWVELLTGIGDIQPFLSAPLPEQQND